MKTLLIGKGIWDIVEDGSIEFVDWRTLATNEKSVRKEAQKNNNFASYHIQSSLEKSIFQRIASCSLAKEEWKALKDGYQGSDQVKKIKLQTLKKEFENLEMNKGQNVGDYFVRAKYYVNKIKNLGDKVKNKLVVKNVLRYLLPKWNHVSIIIEKRKNMNSLNYDHLIGSLMYHE